MACLGVALGLALRGDRIHVSCKGPTRYMPIWKGGAVPHVYSIWLAHQTQDPDEARPCGVSKIKEPHLLVPSPLDRKTSN